MPQPRLSDIHKVAILYSKGISIVQVARQLGLDPTKARSLIRRASSIRPCFSSQKNVWIEGPNAGKYAPPQPEEELIQKPIDPAADHYTQYCKWALQEYKRKHSLCMYDIVKPQSRKVSPHRRVWILPSVLPASIGRERSHPLKMKLMHLCELCEITATDENPIFTIPDMVSRLNRKFRTKYTRHHIQRALSIQGIKKTIPKQVPIAADTPATRAFIRTFKRELSRLTEPIEDIYVMDETSFTTEGPSAKVYRFPGSGPMTIPMEFASTRKRGRPFGSSSAQDTPQTRKRVRRGGQHGSSVTVVEEHARSGNISLAHSIPVHHPHHHHHSAMEPQLSTMVSPEPFGPIRNLRHLPENGTYTAVACMNGTQRFYYWLVRRECIADDMIEFFRKLRAKVCHRRPLVVILDNSPIHRDAHVKTVCDRLKIRLLFIPPYHPEFNAIEMVFGPWRNQFRHLAKRSRFQMAQVVDGIIRSSKINVAETFQRVIHRSSPAR